jgi:hypothetical protein
MAATTLLTYPVRLTLTFSPLMNQGDSHYPTADAADKELHLICGWNRTPNGGCHNSPTTGTPKHPRYFDLILIATHNQVSWS